MGRYAPLLWFATIATIWIGFFTGIVEARAPSNIDPSKYMRAGGPSWGHNVALTANTDTNVLNDNGSYTDERDLQLFEWGTLLVISCEAVTCVCLTLDDDVTIGTGANCGDMADSGTPDDASASTGRSAPCRRVQAGGSVDILVNRSIWPAVPVAAGSPPGYRSGYCSQSTGNTNYPCDATDDCLTSAGAAGTCTADTPDRIAGAFLELESASTTNCFVNQDI